MNELNVKLQCKGLLVHELYSTVKAFMAKLQKLKPNRRQHFHPLANTEGSHTINSKWPLIKMYCPPCCRWAFIEKKTLTRLDVGLGLYYLGKYIFCPAHKDLICFLSIKCNILYLRRGINKKTLIWLKMLNYTHEDQNKCPNPQDNNKQTRSSVSVSTGEEGL